MGQTSHFEPRLTHLDKTNIRPLLQFSYLRKSDRSSYPFRELFLCMGCLSRISDALGSHNQASLARHPGWSATPFELASHPSRQELRGRSLQECSARGPRCRASPASSLSCLTAAPQEQGPAQSSDLPTRGLCGRCPTATLRSSIGTRTYKPRDRTCIALPEA